jgi:hypothetical protein
MKPAIARKPGPHWWGRVFQTPTVCRSLRPEHVLAVALALLLPNSFAAGQDFASAQMSVRELMHMDAELARQQASKRLRAADPQHDVSRSSGSAAPRLAAIYGVGKKLLAEVVIGSRSHVYLRGQALPVGGQAGPGTYMLRGISGSCVHLERAGDSHTLCLRPGLWAGKP